MFLILPTHLYLFGHVVILSVIWSSIYSVIWIQSNGPARTKAVVTWILDLFDPFSGHFLMSDKEVQYSGHLKT